ncbi:MAG: DUF3078 domain-containing protein [Bacteroidales bacterium]|nr:DUF3078 domain-containing protein [Bacteroidales bacterium]
MKKVLTFIFILFFGMSLSGYASSKPADSTNNKHWKYKGEYNVMMNQISFSNWATGGESAVTGQATIDYLLKYKKKRFSFTHSAHMAYGISGYFNKGVEKTDDKLDLNFTVSHKMSKKWEFSGMAIFKSQFTNGYNYPNDSVLASTFMAPGYLTVSLGLTFSPSKKLQMFISPLAGKMTFVLNQDLANKGAYGVTKAVYDSLGDILVPGRRYFGQLGLNFLCTYKAKVMNNIHYLTNLNLYNNYIEPQPDMRWQVDMDWDNRFTFKINDHFVTLLYLHLKYNPKILFPEYGVVDGVNTVVAERTRLQFKETFGLGITYKIN